MLEFDQCFSVDFWNTTVLPNARFSTSLPLSTKCHSSQLLWQRQQQKPSTHFQTAPEASCCLSPAEMRLSHKFQNPHTGQKTNQNTCQPQSLPSHLPSQESPHLFQLLTLYAGLLLSFGGFTALWYWLNYTILLLLIEVFTGLNGDLLEGRYFSIEILGSISNTGPSIADVYTGWMGNRT